MLVVVRAAAAQGSIITHFWRAPHARVQLVAQNHGRLRQHCEYILDVQDRCRRAYCASEVRARFLFCVRIRGRSYAQLSAYCESALGVNGVRAKSAAR